MKQDLNGVRTPQDVIRRFDFEDIPVLVKSTKEIALEVSKKVGDDEIISKINLSPEEATINADKISLQGKTIDLTSNEIEITSKHFKLDSGGNMVCNNAQMVNAKITGGEIDMCSTDEYPRFRIRSDDSGANSTEALMANDFIGLQNQAGLSLAYIYVTGGLAGAELAGHFSIGNTDDGEVIQLDGDLGLVQCNEVACTDLSATDIYYENLYPSSLETKKKDFEELDNALDILKGTDIYKYHFKDEKETDKKHIGFVIGKNYNYRKELTDRRNQGVDLYSMVSVLWKAVQEQQKEIEKLKEGNNDSNR